MSFPHNAPLGRHLLDRRGFLSHMATGVGGIALSALLAEQGLLAGEPADATKNPLAPKKPHFPGKAKRVIHIYCTGAVSHLDTWDYKPELIKRHGQPMPGIGQADHLPGRERGADQEPLGVQAARASPASTSPTCCRTWPSWPMRCASSTR